MDMKPDPISDDTAGVLQHPEPMAVNALIFKGSDDPLNHAVLFGAVGRD